MTRQYTKTAGFTLIEMIVSLGIFSIIITTAVGALLVLIATNQKLQSEQSALTNLSFALDSMTREIRTGYNYYCADSNSNNENVFTGNAHEALGVATVNCPAGRTTEEMQGISFFEGGDSITGTANRIMYYYDLSERTLKRKVGNNAPQTIVSSGLEVEDADFFVTGSEKLTAFNDDSQQPTVTIYLKVRERSQPDKSYYVQTTVTQRILDL